jgi:hypothetical protein
MSNFFFKPKRVKHLCCPPKIDKMDINSPLLIYRFPCRIKLAMTINSSIGSSNHNRCYTVADQTLNAYGKWAGCPGGSGPGYSSTMRYNPGEISSGINPLFGGSVCNCAYNSVVSPVNIIPPVISGNQLVGSTLITNNGIWSGNPAPTFTYQWYRGITLLSGQTNTSYTTVLADIGQIITCRVTGTNDIGLYVAISNSITITGSLNTLNITGFTIGTEYQILYYDDNLNVVSSPAVGGFTMYTFFPTATTLGSYSSSKNIDIFYLVVAGGGGGGGSADLGFTSQGNGGGGGAGGFMFGVNNIVSSISYELQVGGGGAGGVANGSNGINGANSLLRVNSGLITSIGGGGGASGSGLNGNPGGSGGGGAANTNGVGYGGSGTIDQGTNGGNAEFFGNIIAGRGGGATQSGATGGTGVTFYILDNVVVYAGGGGGGANNTGSPQNGGSGGGGNGGYSNGSIYTNATPGTNGLGGGGGGGGGFNISPANGAAGGSGIIILIFASYS